MKLSWWSDVAIANVDSPDAVVHSEDERYEEMVKMGEYFRRLWDARADAPPTFDLVSMLAHSPGHAKPADPASSSQCDRAVDRQRQRHHAAIP